MIIASCSATREDKRRAGQEKTRGQQYPVTSPVTEFRGAASQCPGLVGVARGQEKDKRRTTAGQEKDNWRTRPGHRAQPQSPGARPVSVAVWPAFFLIFLHRIEP